jgi:glucans biosynthesis protein
MIWAGENRGFTIEPLHRGYVFSNPVSLFTVEDEIVRRVAFDRGKFDYGRVTPPPANVDLQFSGMRIATGLERPYEVAIFQGATFFRSLARGQNYGSMARALILRPGETRGEEIPFFRAFWIERPSPASGSLVIHALLDSESLTGAVRMTLRPGDVTLIDVEMTLFARQALDHVGFGCTMGTFLPARRAGAPSTTAPFRARGLRRADADGQWRMDLPPGQQSRDLAGFVLHGPTRGLRPGRARARPCCVPGRRPALRIAAERLGRAARRMGRGFGTAHRDPQRFRREQERHPVLAAAPAAGARQRDDAGLSAGLVLAAAGAAGAGGLGARAAGRGSQGRRRRFIVDFTGDKLADAAVVASTRANITATPGTIQNVRIWPYPERKLMRVGFEVDPGTENFSELRLVLQSGGQPVSETWLNRWTW